MRAHRPIPSLTEVQVSRLHASYVHGPADDCWLWMKATDRQSYGMFVIQEVSYKASRVMYREHYGIDPLDQCVLHHCDNPSCVNPSHLFLGDRTENMEDRGKKGRTARGDRNGKYTKPEKTPRGERHGRAKVTNEIVCKIRKEREEGATLQAIAAKYGVSYSLVGQISRHEIWKHV